MLVVPYGHAGVFAATLLSEVLLPAPAQRSHPMVQWINFIFPFLAEPPLYFVFGACSLACWFVLFVRNALLLALMFFRDKHFNASIFTAVSDKGEDVARHLTSASRGMRSMLETSEKRLNLDDMPLFLKARYGTWRV